jgi:hypothetical protein
MLYWPMLRNLSSFTILFFPKFNAMLSSKTARKATLVQELSCMSLTIMVSISSASIFIVRSFEPLRHGIVPDRRNNALFF